MPEAAVDVHGDLRTPEDNVRNAPHTGEGLLVHPEPEPEGVQRGAKRKLDFRVPRALSDHAPPGLLGRR